MTEQKTKKSELTAEELLKMAECDKLANISKKSQEIGSFIRWLGQKKHIYLAIRFQGTTELLEPMTPIGTLLAEYFQVDMERVDAELNAWLDHLRKKTEENVQEMQNIAWGKKHREIF